MGISELRRLEMPPGPFPAGRTPLERDLVARGTVSDGDMRLARRVGQVCDATLDRILTAEGLVKGEELLEAHARHFHSRRVGAQALEQMPVAPTGIAPALLLRHGVLPVYDRDGRAALVCHTPEGRAAIRPHLPPELRDAGVLWASRAAIQDRIAQAFRPALSEAMVTRVPEVESCRTWDSGRRVRLAAVLGGLVVMVAVSVLWPHMVLAVLTGWAVITLAVAALFKTAAFVARLVAGPQTTTTTELTGDAPLPRVSVLVPLFKETEIVHALVTRLGRLTYPKCLLEVVLVLEETDTQTRDTLARIDLPPWMRPVVVPDGTPRTKPRAMNYALDFCEGDIIGVFDAEDAPDPDQITQVARRFQAAPPEVVCLQGILDYYNARQNWLARCFTIEYAAWFRLVLPGLARLGFAIPLGGTTLFFRRDALERLGGWDAHNVTEDADLGFRLGRHGMRTEMIETVTREEANCLPWPWIKQRSRWLKGYMTTYLVHMRRPRLLRRQLGTWAFLGFQAHFVTTVSQVLLAPLLWSFWLVLLGLPHPMDAYLPHGAMLGLGALFLAVEVINLAIHATAVSGRMHRHLLPWTPTMHFYMPLAAVAGYKALYELALKPFFWDKTRHGLSLRAVRPAGDHGAADEPVPAALPLPAEEPILRRPPEAQLRQAVDLS